MAVSALHITAKHSRQFRTEGFFVLKRTLPPDDLDTLRGECQRFIDERDREMDRLGADNLDLDRRGSRYFVHAYGKSPAVERFLSSEIMVQIAQAALGDTVYLFNEQYVVKAAEQGMPFSWHQDSGFIDYPHRPYLTCWIALDDMTEANGTIYLLPYSRAGTRDVIKHARDEESNDLVGYFGHDPGDPVIVPAGSIGLLLVDAFPPQRPQHHRPRASRLRGTIFGRADPQRRRLTPAEARRASPGRGQASELTEHTWSLARPWRSHPDQAVGERIIQRHTAREAQPAGSCAAQARCTRQA